MKVLLSLLAALLLVVPAQAQEAIDVFPYDYAVQDYDNGLRAVVVPTDYPNIVSLQIVVATGSRNEVEPGKSGFAHFFEHMMFRGTENYSSEEYREILKNAGADQNAYTTDDYTNYHITFSKDDLDTILALEADRFQRLQYSVEDFKTESRAVLGEYNKNSANPVSKLFEVMRDAAFEEHTYEHTTMGFLEDIEDMPNQYDYSLTFFDRFYRPEYTTIVVTGDVETERVFELVEEHWGEWEQGSYQSEIPTEPPLGGPVYEHVEWETPTLPWVMLAFRGPAFSDETSDLAALDLLSSLAFSSSSPLYEKLVVKEQKAQQLWSWFPNRVDPNLLVVAAQVKDVADVWYVRDQIQRTLAGLRATSPDADRLADIKSNMIYGFAGAMDDSEAIASTLASYLALTREVETINRVYNLYDDVSPDLVQAMAQRYFTDSRMVVTTLAHEELPPTETPAGSVDAFVAAMDAPAEQAAVETVLLQNDSPLINFRFLFGVGAASDPAGKAGLAELTARMVEDAGSQSMSYEEIQQALFPLAAGFGTQVDKEMTVFGGQIHRDNLDAYYAIIKDQLLNPAFRQADFERIKSSLINEVRVSLRGNNDEELGKEVLYEVVYQDHPYGTLTRGHVADLEAITLDDVRQFYADHYTQANLTLGLAGGYPDAFLETVMGDLAALPEGTPTAYDLPQPGPIDGLEVTIVDKNTRATAISMGFPIDVTRASDDFAALWLARSYFGEHRSSNSYLYQRIRETRGMNYGDYAYIEYFPNGMFQFHPDANLGRQQQLFQIWIRPVRPEQAHFATRVALYELEKLIEEGMTEADFEATRNYLLKFVNVLTASQDRQLGYALDSEYYGIPGFTDYIKTELEGLTVEDVNRAIRTHLQRDDMHLVFIAPNAEELRDQLVSDAPSPITYDAPKPDALLDEDAVIERYPLGIQAEKVTILPVEEVFENGQAS